MTCKKMNQLQGGSHREVERHMPSAALFKVKAIAIYILNLYTSANEGMTKMKLQRGFSQLFAPLEISRNLKCPTNQN